ncbi:hypothetical protein DFH08DRAFT_799567 [Mycena albidolilacea]|uniref:Uncharacterized protein n=1 Tax=Mycena albidolilacea TaxID=1033008 RepID=A0AAD7AM13_9AGAR|nr:hypothetical protein DFH08DRAFT_799567 [Mycena albidolilacea]
MSITFMGKIKSRKRVISRLDLLTSPAHPRQVLQLAQSVVTQQICLCPHYSGPPIVNPPYSPPLAAVHISIQWSMQHSVTVPLKEQHSGFCTFRDQSAAEDAASRTVQTTYRPHNNIKLVVIQDPLVLKHERCMENKFEKSRNHVLHTSQGSTVSHHLSSPVCYVRNQQKRRSW